jgi:hypothetical protein
MVVLHENNTQDVDVEHLSFFYADNSDTHILIPSIYEGPYSALLFQKYVHDMVMTLSTAFLRQNRKNAAACPGVRACQKIAIQACDVCRPSRDLKNIRSQATCGARHPPAWYIKASPPFSLHSSFNNTSQPVSSKSAG